MSVIQRLWWGGIRRHATQGDTTRALCGTPAAGKLVDAPTDCRRCIRLLRSP